MIKNRFFKSFGLQKWIVATLLLAPFAFDGCVKRTEFEQDMVIKGGIEIALEWPVDALSRPLTFAFYHTGEGALLYKEFEGTAEGFKGVLPVGEYSVIAYDKSALKVKYRNMDSYSTAEVYAEEAVKAPRAGNGMQICEPGAVFSAGECVGMATLKIVGDKTLKTTAQPKNRTRCVALNFDIKNGENISGVSGVMDGVSSSILLATACSANYSARLPFHVDRATNGLFQTSVSLFDFISAEDGEMNIHTMDVTLGRTDGGTHDMTLDLTDTIRDIIHENGGVIPIEIPIEVVVDMTDVENITAIVHPWEKGTGGGEVID